MYVKNGKHVTERNDHDKESNPSGIGFPVKGIKNESGK
jgi:hypothetical protein